MPFHTTSKLGGYCPFQKNEKEKKEEALISIYAYPNLHCVYEMPTPTVQLLLEEGSYGPL